MVLDELPRGVPGAPPGTGTAPRAEWMATGEIISDPEYAFDPSKVFLGHLEGKLIGVGDDRHVVLCAGSRAGKGRSVIVPNLIEYKGSVLAIDPKAELANITARHRAEGLGQRVFVLDPFGKASDEAGQYRAAYNPMTLLSRGSPTIIEDAGLIADALVVPSGGDSHWDDSARNFLEGIILHVATSPDYSEGERHLITVRDVLSGRHRAEQSQSAFSDLQRAMQDNARRHEQTNEDLAAALDAAAADFFDKPDNERNSVLSTLRKQTKFLDYKSMRDVLSGHSFDLTELKTAPFGTTIYLCLPAGRMSTCNRWFRLFVNLALESMEREDTKPPVPVLLCLDEFPVLGHMRQIEVAAGQIAGFGVKLMTVIQDLSQLKSIYKDRWETFMGNAGVLIFFGNNDVTTLEFIQKRLGKTTLVVARKSDVSAKSTAQGGSGMSWSTETHDLITIEEASRIFGRSDEYKRELVIHAGKKPMILKRLHYDTHPYFEGKFSER